MNGVHDLGGLQCFGPIVREADEPCFHEPWEKRVFALFFGGFAAGLFNVDMFRAEIERMPAHEYLRTSYYEHWLHAIESLVLNSGTVSEAELRARIAELATQAAH